MHLQSLELFGFKSFADKTVFTFHEGVTAIVGPNGCGKSNLLDAIKWVLGEQSAKSLRGGEMADVIFNGTDSRKPLGFAEVSLTFTDCSKELGVEWHDVQVTRRVYRDGNSEYFLNKTGCRLRDIQSLFADTGVARSAYSMMEQGKIDMILSSRPEDRRAVFEEAAGITKFKTQKREALRKLEATEANLLRIGDVIKEVKRQIGSLQRQAGKARRYQALHSDLRVLDTHYSRKQLDALEQELADCRAEIAKFSASEQTTRAEIDAGETGIHEARHALDRIDAEVSEARAGIQMLQSEIATHRSRIEFNRQRAQELKELIDRARSEIDAAEAKRSEQAAQIRDADASLEKSKETLKERENDLVALTEQLSRARSQRAKLATDAQDLQISLTKLQAQVSGLEDELQGTITRREAAAAQAGKLEAEIAHLTRILEKTTGDIRAAQAAAGAREKQIADRLADIHRAEEHLRHQQESFAEAEKKVTEFERSMAEKKSRLDVLRQLNQEGRGLSEGSQAVLNAVDERFRASIVGPLASQLDVDPRFIAAVEAALGRNLHAVVLKNAEVAEEIIDRVTRKKLGKAALLLPQSNASVSHSVRKILPKGAIAWAVDKAVAPRQLEPLVHQLLNNVVIFSRLDQALECKKDDPTLAAATLNGEFISAEGIVFGGSTTVKTDSLLERKAEIALLEKEELSLETERENLLAKRDEVKAALAAASLKVNQAREIHQNAHLSHSTETSQIALRERERDDLARRRENLESEKSTLHEQLAAADDSITELKEKSSDLDAQLATLKTTWTASGAAQENANVEEARAMEKLNEVRLAIATEKQRHESLQLQRQPMAEREKELVEMISARQVDISRYEAKIASQAQESLESEAAIDSQTAECKRKEESAATIGEQRTSRLSAIADREKQLRALHHSLSEMQERRGQAQVRESQLQMQTDNLVENVERRYQVDLRSFVQDVPVFEKTLRAQLKKRLATEASPDSGTAPADTKEAPEPAPEKKAPEIDLSRADVEKFIAEMTRQLDNMGPVNLDAVQEYDELEERYKFLESQNNDLTNSRRELLDVIARINSTTRNLFAETFAQVRVNFREMFAELFGGGRADLSLMDESDPLNCGIEIAAKPPGKQLQSVSLLSGGERAMTAVALLFAIYMVRPSPFCVLDEMDAPLDESNINRFIRMLDRFTGQSQFVIITHNKRTIAKAGVLYGVTMEERGISKLVGMKLTAPAEKNADQVSNGNGHTETATQRNFTLVAR